MKNVIFSLLLSVAISFIGRAADIVVDITGAGGAYTTIQSAIDAAFPGDRLLIASNGLPFGENLTINKSLSLLCLEEAERFNLQGNIVINSNGSLAGGSIVTISGMRNPAGSITANTDATGVRVKVYLLNCRLDNGLVNLDKNNYNLTMQDDSLIFGRVIFRFGTISGCFIKQNNEFASAITLNSDSQPSNDHVYVVGNRIEASVNPGHPSIYNSCFKAQSTSHYFFVSNNYLYTFNYYSFVIDIMNSKTGGALQSHIANNTIFQFVVGYFAINITSSSSPISIYNNAFINGTLGINANTFSVNNILAYNHFNSSFTTPMQNVADNGTNVLSSGNTIDAQGKVLTGAGLDGGNPDFADWDLNDTRNDAGCFGGSWSRENFMASSANSRTSLVFSPHRVVSGAPLNISAFGYDK